jgi:integrase
MPRKEKLDRYVSTFIDRTGRVRYRFRRGKVSVYLPPPTSKEYKAAYSKAKGEAGVIDRAVEGSVNDLVARFYRTVQFRRVSPAWQQTMRQAIEPFRLEYGNDMVTHFRPKDIDRIVENRFEKRIVDGKRFGGSASAERLRELLLRLFRLAVKLEWRADNPVTLSEPVRHKGKGFYTWTEQDIAAYRARWPLGTKARLAMELMLWTGARRGNAHMMEPPRDGRIRATAVKTKKAIDVPVAPALKAAIEAMPDGTIGETLIVTEFGKPFSRAGFGNKMREWCDAANLPHCTSHGLRKALATRAANAKVGQQGLKALGQWSQDKEVSDYTTAANRVHLAEDALGAVVAWEEHLRTLANLDMESVE